jgi:hypothetical protein
MDHDMKAVTRFGAGKYMQYGMKKGALYVVLGSLLWSIIAFGVTSLHDLATYGYVTDFPTVSGSFEDFLSFFMFVLLGMWFLGVVVAVIPGAVGGALLGKSYHTFVVHGSFPNERSWLLGILIGAICGFLLLLLAMTWFDDPVIGVSEPERTILLLSTVAIAMGLAGLAGWQMSQHTFDNAESGTISNS